MSAPLTANEEAQTLQTIEMFEVITQSDPSDYVSLEILKEAYFKLGRHKEVVNTAKRIAQAYVHSGQISSAILEYESILQLFPNDPDVQAALADIENKSAGLSGSRANADADMAEKPPPAPINLKLGNGSPTVTEIDDGRRSMQKLLVDGKHLSLTDFNLFWNTPNVKESPKQVNEPFIQTLAEKQLLPLDKSLKLVCEKARLSYLPLDRYDVDIEFARSFPRDICLRWCILPFDRMSKSVMLATANPFNEQVVRELDKAKSDPAAKNRWLWYIASPTELLKILRKVFR
jgi:tetratricopeptide (TPR) repeat protein